MSTEVREGDAAPGHPKAASAAANEKSAAIVSPLFDFFMVGGTTFFIVPIVLLPFWSNAQNIDVLLLASYLLLFVLNIPHFVHSYQLLYRNYGEKIMSPQYSRVSRLRHWIAGVIAPLVMIGYFIVAVMLSSKEMLGLSVNAMLFFTGWHYVKQGYGIMIALGVRKKAFLDDFEKKLLLVNAYVAWIYAWLQLNRTADSGMFQDVPFSSIGVPEPIIHAINLAFMLWSFVLVWILVKRFDGNRPISVNGFVAYFSSIYIWVAFAYSHPHIIIFVPAMHSAQYILMVWKVVYERTKEEVAQKKGEAAAQAMRVRDVFLSMTPFILVGTVGGALVFLGLPVILDKVITYNTSVFGSSLFVFMFLIFLNIHHYFIDFAIWRRENPEMRYLFK